MQYATCTANRPTSIGSSSNGLTAHSSTNNSPKPNEASKQANERTNERSNVRHRRRIFMTMAQFIYRSAL